MTSPSPPQQVCHNRQQVLAGREAAKGLKTSMKLWEVLTFKREGSLRSCNLTFSMTNCEKALKQFSGIVFFLWHVCNPTRPSNGKETFETPKVTESYICFSTWQKINIKLLTKKLKEIFCSILQLFCTKLCTTHLKCQKIRNHKLTEKQGKLKVFIIRQGWGWSINVSVSMHGVLAKGSIFMQAPQKKGVPLFQWIHTATLCLKERRMRKWDYGGHPSENLN